MSALSQSNPTSCVGVRKQFVFKGNNLICVDFETDIHACAAKDESRMFLVFKPQNNVGTLMFHGFESCLDLQ